MSEKRRADLLLVERGFYASRPRAQEAIGAIMSEALRTRAPDAAIDAKEPHPYVSRGGVKLAAALDAFRLDPTGLVCLDIGASTGGFTEVLVARGAARVYAVDVGHGQLHPKVLKERRVVSLEGTDARRLDRALVPDPIGLVVADVSFISLRLVLPPVLPLLAGDACMALLVKPQFEAGPAFVKKGIVRDETVRRTVCREMEAFVAALGFTVIGIVPSPIEGGDGNREYLLGARRV